MRLVTLGITVGALAEGSVRSNTRRALAVGAGADVLRQDRVVRDHHSRLPAAIAALGWIDEVIDGAPVKEG
jgi:hypothetical protein